MFGEHFNSAALDIASSGHRRTAALGLTESVDIPLACAVNSAYKYIWLFPPYVVSILMS